MSLAAPAADRAAVITGASSGIGAPACPTASPRWDGPTTSW